MRAMMLTSLFWSAAIFAQSPAKPDYNTYLQGIKSQAVEQGISQATVDKALSQATFIERAVKLDKSQPEFKLTLDTYLPKAVPKWKIKQARDLYKKHLPELTEIGEMYGVQPRFIVALWGIETNFGGYTGNFDVVSALATLAYDGRREAFFKEQLFAALQILDEGHISLDKMKGSWAGAMGQCQFMPTSFLTFAVDHDGDGRKDIWQTKVDVFASAANYLKQSGWNDDLTWGRQVQVPANLDLSITGLKQPQKTLAQWQAMGVRKTDGSDLPTRDISAWLVLPDDKDGRAYLAYDNYATLMKWNRSNYFVAAVGTLADSIAYPPIK
ncbi:lytic murein transglycosylase [Motilimonas eburnea]|uniref:lytic murein transglycosylase n=1 Tax=Motilimonas eburnea TaxID=1737488 RepID=UPI001E3D3F6F|nr:lytic murein transglycosylase [Motilimonas eburnea]MCE2571914.1 lytic murein transglycosylase [Motilimonas eburnea]